MRILIINQAYHPDLAATAQHAHDLAKHLSEQGHTVSVVASRSLYGNRNTRLPKQEVTDRITVYRVGRSIFNKTGTVARSIDFLLFYLLAVAKTLTLPRQDVTICLTTPPFLATAGALLKALRKTPFIYWVMDLYPDLAIACGVLPANAPMARILERVNRHCLNSAATVVALGRCMAARIEAKGTRPDRIIIIPPWSSQKCLPPPYSEDNPFRKQLGVTSQVLVMYSGNFGLGHDLDTLLKAARHLHEDPFIHFAFIGGGKQFDATRKYLVSHDLSSTCSVLPWQPQNLLDCLLSAADIHLISLKKGAEGIMVPSKLYGVLESGRPAIFVGSTTSEVARTLYDHQCGTTIENGDSEGLANEILRLAKDQSGRHAMGSRAKLASRRSCSRLDKLGKWANAVESLRTINTAGITNK